MVKRKGQSTLEYVIIFAAAAGMLIAVAVYLNGEMGGIMINENNTLKSKIDAALK